MRGAVQRSYRNGGGDGRNERVGVERKDSQVCQVEGVRLGVKVRFSSAAVVW